jgi:HSP20 family molecular chaperone IbpA
MHSSTCSPSHARDTHKSERRRVSHGKFSRSLRLPRGVNGKAVSARHENGVLVITLPRAAERKNVTNVAIKSAL